MKKQLHKIVINLFAKYFVWNTFHNKFCSK